MFLFGGSYFIKRDCELQIRSVNVDKVSQWQTLLAELRGALVARNKRIMLKRRRFSHQMQSSSAAAAAAK